MKKCSKCAIEKDEIEFSKDKRAKDGLYSVCKECYRVGFAVYYEKEKDKINGRKAKYREENRDKVRAYHVEYREKNKEKLNTCQAEYMRKRRKTDTLYYDLRRIRALTYDAFRRANFTKRSRTFALVGCLMEELLVKWGVQAIPEGWHVDHIVPLSQAKTIEEVEKLCHWSNLQLLPASDNLAKSDNRTEQNAALCLDLLGREWV